jgi:hypothetical protein
MSRLIGNHLPPQLIKLLSGRRRRKIVIELLTVDGNGFPHICLLSPYQVVTKSGSDVLFCVYADSETSRLLEKLGRCTFVFFAPPAAFYVKATVEVLPLIREKLRFYNVRSLSVYEDLDGGAPIMTVPTFKKGSLSEYRRVFRELMRIAG